MGKAKDVKIATRNAIISTLAAGNTTIDGVARQFGLCRRTIQRIKKAGVITQSTRVGKCLSRRITTASGDRLIVRDAISNPRATLTQLCSVLRQSGVKVSRMTISRRLKERNICFVKPTSKPHLTPAMRKKRLAWANKYAHWTVEDWSKVCFSDESSFECHDANKRLVLHQPGTPRPTTPSVKFPTKVMVWSMMCVKGTGRLHVVEGTMNAEKYVDVLKSRMLPQAREWFGAEEWLFMQDGAPCHTAKRSINYLASENVTVIDWPGNSPDMNPIETLWGIMKARLRSKTITTKTDMICQLIQVWLKDASVATTCERLIQSMPLRVRALIEAKGGHTKF